MRFPSRQNPPCLGQSILGGFDTHHLKLKIFNVATVQSCKKLQLTYKVSRCV